MSVETHCPYESQKQRRGIAQHSLSSLYGEKPFSVNRDRQKERELRCCSANNDSTTQILNSSHSQVSDDVIREEIKHLDVLNTITAKDTASVVWSFLCAEFHRFAIK